MTLTPRWRQAKGIIELYELVSSGKYRFSSDTLREVLGHEPVSTREWLRQVADHFRQDGAPPSPDVSARASGRAISNASMLESLQETSREQMTMLEALQEGSREAFDVSDAATTSAVNSSSGAGSSAKLAPARPRRPTVILMDEMEEIWQDVYLLESQGKHEDAERVRDAKLLLAEERYRKNNASYDYGNGESNP